MTISRDAYLFYPYKFVNRVKPFLQKFVSRMKGYQYIRTETLRIIEKNQNVAFLASEYGGWDNFSIKTQIPEDYPKDIEDIIFWFSLLLYSQVEKTEASNLGLESNFRFLKTILNEYGWNETETELLISGRSFSDLLPAPSSRGVNFQIGEVDIEQLWDHFRPNSTLGKFSWISIEDVKILLPKFDDEKFSRFIYEYKYELEIYIAFQKSLEMYKAARNDDSGLLYVISG